MGGLLPSMCSIRSSSPQAGQLTVVMLLPSIQNEGDIPCDSGSINRASMRPYWTLHSPPPRGTQQWIKPAASASDDLAAFLILSVVRDKQHSPGSPHGITGGAH